MNLTAKIFLFQLKICRKEKELDQKIETALTVVKNLQLRKNLAERRVQVRTLINILVSSVSICSLSLTEAFKLFYELLPFCEYN